MIDFPCRVCRTPLQVDDTLSGKLVRCPNCLGTMTVPGTTVGAAAAPSPTRRADSPSATPAVPGDGPGPATPPAAANTLTRSLAGGPGRRYGFNCPYCSSRLEANEAMAASEGTCPTCGSTITIPLLDRFGRLVDPVTREIIKPDPHPVHAYAAAGERAPRIVRRADGKQWILCPRCGATAPVEANSCGACGMPFTMEGTTPVPGGSASGVAVTALVLGILGILGIPASCTVLVPLLAIGFGIAGLYQSRGEGRGFAIAGILCGLVGLAVSAMIYLF